MIEPTILQAIIGYTSAAIVALLNIPQTIKVYQMKSADSLSFPTLFLHLISSILWFCYGSMLHEIPIIIANVVYFSANIALIVGKIRFSKK